MRYLPLDFVVMIFTFSVSCLVGVLALFSLLMRNHVVTFVLLALYLVAFLIFLSIFVSIDDSEEKLVQRRAI